MTHRAWLITRITSNQEPDPLPVFGIYFTQGACEAAIAAHGSYGALQTTASASFLAAQFALVPCD